VKVPSPKKNVDDHHNHPHSHKNDHHHHDVEHVKVVTPVVKVPEDDGFITVGKKKPVAHEEEKSYKKPYYPKREWKEGDKGYKPPGERGPYKERPEGEKRPAWKNNEDGSYKERPPGNAYRGSKPVGEKKEYVPKTTVGETH